jgi:Protein of unknown function (DUF4239)
MNLMSVDLALSIFVIFGATVAAVGLMLLIRRWSPPGGFFANSPRSAGVFGVVGTGFAVLLAFVIFLAFNSYDLARAQASREAVAVRQQYRIAKFFSSPEGLDLRGEIICYGRAVVHDEWRTMRDGQASVLVDGRANRIEQMIENMPIDSERERIVYGSWFDQSAERREGRRGRLAVAAPFIPPIIWLALLLDGLLIIIYMCFYADRAEGKITQAMMMAAVTAMIVSGLLVVRFLDSPYDNAIGSIKPTEMTRTLAEIEPNLEGIPGGDESFHIYCDKDGQP